MFVYPVMLIQTAAQESFYSFLVGFSWGKMSLPLA